MRCGAAREEQDQNREEEGAGTIHRREAFFLIAMNCSGKPRKRARGFCDYSVAMGRNKSGRTTLGDPAAASIFENDYAL
jgi:hypothetical protein